MNNNLQQILKERGNEYGEYTDVSKVYKELCSLVKIQNFPPELYCAMTMILQKIARLAVGNKCHLDSWVDIGGYSKLASDFLVKKDKNT